MEQPVQMALAKSRFPFALIFVSGSYNKAGKQERGNDEEREIKTHQLR